MSLYQPSRDQARQFLFDAWGKFQQQVTLTDLEKIVVSVIQMHPEYHSILDNPQQNINKQYFPEMGQTNPFLHLNLHLSVIEQINIDQPIGIKAAYAALLNKHADSHLAQHELLDCLAETIWHAQRHQISMDSEHYLALINEKIKGIS